uniref:Uncharacterized protein n=1 Tax=Anguilla anguilla TaxID=7936 RepID=A0A0E9RFM3_ANGAN
MGKCKKLLMPLLDRLIGNHVYVKNSGEINELKCFEKCVMKKVCQWKITKYIKDYSLMSKTG